MPVTTRYEEKFWPDLPWICGIDEAGRGPLAGPVVAAAVVFPRHFRPEGLIATINDSKQIPPGRREDLATAIMAQAEDYAVAVVDHTEIDRINIFQATMLAMNNAAGSLALQPSLLLIDGNRFHPAHSVPFETIVKGDARVFSIAAASLLAKTHRDRIMKQAALLYPEYGFEKHFGYPTRAHIEAIRNHGRSPIHRMSFRLRQLGEK